MRMVSWKKIYAWTVKLAWAAFLVCLPVTSFPFFPSKLGGDLIVRPLSMFPLAALFILVTIPQVLREPVPGTFKTLLPFIIAALISSVLSLVQGINSTFGVSVAQRVLRASITLGLGVAIYTTVSIIPRKFGDLRGALRWIYAGFSLALLWGSIQAAYIVHFSKGYYRWVSRIQKLVSTRRLFENRVSGLTFEPNWFAEQICILMIPWLLASVLNGYSVFRWRWRWLTVEWLLLGWSVGILAFTFSRAGLLTVFALVFISLVVLNPARERISNRASALSRGWRRRLLQASLALTVITGFVFFAGSNNSFFSRIWNYWSTRENTSLAGYIDYLGFGARMIYNATALNVYQSHPALGVGLGNYAFYFEDMMPDRLIAETPEVLHLLTLNVERFRLMTPKNLYLRILAETGIVGMAAFLGFMIAIFGCGLYLYFSPHKEQKFWGTASIYLLAAVSITALTFDSFAIPNMWVAFGMITAATWISKRWQASP
jgi:O-antigen ligase